MQERGQEILFPLSKSDDNFNRLATLSLYWDSLPNHKWSHINRRKSCYEIFWIVFVINDVKPLLVLDCQCRFPDIFFWSNFSIRPNNKALVVDLLLFLLYKPHCFKYYQPHNLYYYQPQTRIQLCIIYLLFPHIIWF